jgi:hypothetical protein
MILGEFGYIRFNNQTQITANLFPHLISSTHSYNHFDY